MILNANIINYAKYTKYLNLGSLFCNDQRMITNEFITDDLQKIGPGF